MIDIKEFIDKCEYKIYKFEESILNKEYGSIKMVSLKLNKTEGYPIVIIPGYSSKSFCSMLKIILDNITDIIDKYSNLYMVLWSPEIKDTLKK